MLFMLAGEVEFVELKMLFNIVVRNGSSDCLWENPSCTTRLVRESRRWLPRLDIPWSHHMINSSS